MRCHAGIVWQEPGYREWSPSAARRVGSGNAEGGAVGPLEGMTSSKLPRWGRGRSAPWFWPTWGRRVIRIDRKEGGEPLCRWPWTRSAGAGAPSSWTSSARRGGGRCCAWWRRPMSWWKGSGGGGGAPRHRPRRLLGRNPRLVYGRMTGWGQEGPLAARPGTTSTTSPWSGRCTRSGGPAAPRCRSLNLLGDFRGWRHAGRPGDPGCLWERQQSGRGHVVDRCRHGGRLGVADGHCSPACGRPACGATSERDHLLDTARPSTTDYETADGQFMASGPRAAVLHGALRRLGLEPRRLPMQYDPSGGPSCGSGSPPAFSDPHPGRVGAGLRRIDACVAPVLTMEEAIRPPAQPGPGHLRGGGRITQRAGAAVQPGPFGRAGTARRAGASTPRRSSSKPASPGAEVAGLRAAGPSDEVVQPRLLWHLLDGAGDGDCGVLPRP